jgi:DNA-binding NarL/FixJ family response regulator
MRFKWTSVTESEFERLVERCNFTPIELQILELRRKGKSPLQVADKMKFSERQIYRISCEVVVKIKKEI